MMPPGTLALPVAVLLAVSAAAAPELGRWGARSRGLRCRASPVEASRTEEGWMLDGLDRVVATSAGERLAPVALAFEIRNETDTAIRLAAPEMRSTILCRTKPRLRPERLRVAKPGSPEDVRWDPVTGAHFEVAPPPPVVEMPPRTSVRGRLVVYVPFPITAEAVDLRVEYEQYDDGGAWIGTVRSRWLRVRLQHLETEETKP